MFSTTGLPACRGLVWNARQVLESGAGLLFPREGVGVWVAHCWALRNQAVSPDGGVCWFFCGCLVVG